VIELLGGEHKKKPSAKSQSESMFEWARRGVSGHRPAWQPPENQAVPKVEGPISKPEPHRNINPQKSDHLPNRGVAPALLSITRAPSYTRIGGSPSLAPCPVAGFSPGDRLPEWID